MRFYLVAVSHRTHNESLFTYHSQQELKAGSIVLVEVSKRQLPGVVIKKTNKPEFTTKEIIRLIEERPLPSALLALADWLEQYYMAPASSVWQTLLPRGADKKRRDTQVDIPHTNRKKKAFTLNSQQQSAVKKILSKKSGTLLLQGITGSGKTAVYIEAAKDIIQKQHRSVVVLVPEIALTSQLISEFSQHFSDILVTHSSMTEAQRHSIWRQALYADKPYLVIGPRSALFLPLENIGLIVIDEAHETSFKQEQTPRYSALRAARVLADQHHASLVLGSATPSVVDRFLADKSGSVVRLDTLAKQAGDVSTKLVDNRKRTNFTRHHFFSNTLLETIEKTLKNNQQILLFHNRRGSASVTLCENCGWSATCDNCFVPLVLHTDQHRLICHVCGLKYSVPTTCPDCGHTGVVHKGIGTKTIAEAIEKLYPKARVARFDADTSSDKTLEKLYQDVYDGNIDIIVGTQVVAKGLDLPNLATVGVVQADGGLILPDFAAEERVFQLLLQVMGRVGRDEKLSTIVVQTYQPESVPIQAALARDYEKFYDYTLSKRRHDNFPPFTYLLKLTCVYKTEAGAASATRKMKQILQKSTQNTVEILGPTPAFYERARGSYRWQLIVKSKRREDLLQLTKLVPSTKWQIELDPISLI